MRTPPIPSSRPLAWCIAALTLAISLAIWGQATRPAASNAPTGRNIATAATPSTSFVSGHESLDALNDGFDPRNQNDHRRGAYGNWPRTGPQWVEYDWSKPISTNKVAVYWWVDGQGVHAPISSRLLYWNGTSFVPVDNAEGLGVATGRYNETTFDEVTTSKLRLEFDGGQFSTGIIEWKVIDSGKSPKFPPQVNAGIERTVVLPAKTYLNAQTKGDAAASTRWSKESGPGEVSFDDPSLLATAASFTVPGDYTLKLTSTQDDLSSSGQIHVKVVADASLPHLQPINTTHYKINSPLWNGRAKALIVNWIPHCIDECEQPSLQTSDPRVRQPTGGIDNFIEAGNKLAGRPYKPHVGYVFSNAWVHNTVEAMCVALQVDAQGDQDILSAQKLFREKLDKWIPIILAAQEPDGYLQTRFTLGNAREQNGRIPGHWTVKGDHEGYTAGYFLESAVANYLLTNGDDRRMYDAAKRLADCWYDNIGPAPKKAWYDGHEEMEQALVRFGRLVNQVEGADANGRGKGNKYIELAKFLLDCRKNGEEYDQSALPVTQQYEAVGHSVRAAYLHSAMADIAMETHDHGYQSAVLSLWDNVINKKYYVTGGIGSGETSEGYGKNYSLPNNSYCESCSNCGELFFQWKMNLAYHDSRYVDLYEETLYNAILGDIDLDGKNFTYTNALDSRGRRYAWHTCPCCVGNIPRTLLALPTWMYAKDENNLYVNLFIGSTVNVGDVAGTPVEVVQATDYPWNGKVAVTVNPATPREFGLRLRSPNRSVSALYSDQADANGISSITVNGEKIAPTFDRGYAVISRQWKAGDKVEMELPMTVQRVKCIDQVAANRGKVALRYGPLIYSVESVDQPLDQVLSPDAPLAATFKPDLLGGVMAITGKWANGSTLLAVPNYARDNRSEQRSSSIVWMRDQ